jgi:hypothetical protein
MFRKPRAARLAEAVAGLGRARANGEIEFTDDDELVALALYCDDAGLPLEATRVRGWIAGTALERKTCSKP